MHDHLFEQMLKAAGNEGRQQSATNIAEQPRKSIAERGPRRSLLGRVNTDQLKDVGEAEVA